MLYYSGGAMVINTMTPDRYHVRSNGGMSNAGVEFSLLFYWNKLRYNPRFYSNSVLFI